MSTATRAVLLSDMDKEEVEETWAAMLAVSSWPAMQQRNAAAYFGLSCAFAVLRRSGGCDLLGAGRPCRWSRRRELALRERVGELEREVEELRRRRVEDARANEKVAGIFAAHEQQWFTERKGLRRQVHAVVAAARAREAAHEGAAAELTRQLEEQQQRAAEAMEQEARGSEEAEEKLRAAEQSAEEHSGELRKHKAALVELASAQRQLEAELVLVARRGDAAEAELREALERRDEAAATAAELSAEAARLRRDAEHKDKILSAMLRKSKIDMEDREMLVREVKMCKARRKQAELEADRWRKMWESRHRRGSRSSARDHPGCSDKPTSPNDAVAPCAHDTKILFVDHVEEADAKKDRHMASTPAKDPTTVECVDRYPTHVDDKPVVEEYQDLQEWFKMETEKYTSMIRHRHNAEVEAFTEQLRLKDEKLEAFRWRMVSMDVEASRLRSRIQELEARLSEQEQRSAAVEALLVGRDDENRLLRERLASSDQAGAIDDDDTEIYPTSENDGGGCEHSVPCSPEGVVAAGARLAEIKLLGPVSPDEHKNTAFDMEAIDVQNGASTALPDELIEQEQRPIAPSRNSYTCEIEEEEDEEKGVFTDPGNARSRDSTDHQEVTSSSELALVVAVPPEQRTSASKMDIQALAVSYKIKRLKQQLLVLEKLAAAAAGKGTATVTAKPSSNAAATAGGGRQQYPRSYQMMVSFLSKHVKRYQSFEDKIDDLCTRMEESKRGGGRERRRRESEGGSREQSAALAQFLEETFQLQRYMVATGQRLLEMQSRIAPSLARAGGNGDDGVDMGRFVDVVGGLLRDVQRGLEVRIARIIGDLEGTLTFHGILHTTF
ncbi:hypothetical protein E2562_021632 [Oryza meyeriana var. granulata]|uniref:Uncharacterized protein n=1 Tax=Oryza meyeriana var. granulata TaxID=110450 RepID=A0A6G1DZS3_9ORYZ|nr:hypothetical protein E2562_021632 [Oryza meyeriana var. granulata]